MANRFDINTISPIGISPTAVSTPGFLPQDKTDIFGTAGQAIKTQFQKSQEAQKQLTRATGGVDVFGAVGGLQKVTAKGIQKAPQIYEAADSALSKLISIIKSAKPIRKEITALQSAERSERIGKASGILESVEGEKAFIQAKGALKGPLIPQKPRFEPLRAIPQISPKIAPELQPLAQEARKYKSAEEFVNSQKFLYHGTSDIYANRIVKEGFKAAHPDLGVSLTNDIKIAQEVAEGAAIGSGGKPTILIVDASKTKPKTYFQDPENLMAKMGEHTIFGNEIKDLKVLGKDINLTDFYEQAVGKVEEIAGKLDQSDIDTLFIQIQRHPNLSPFEKISTADGFSQLMMGEIPQPSKLSLLEDVFGKELIQETLKKRPTIDKLKDLATEVLNIPRSLMASFDMSAPLRQGIIFTATKPKTALRAGYQMFRQAFSEKNYTGWLDDIKKDPLYRTMQDSGLYIADPRRVSGGLAAREERFMSNLAEKIPIIGSGIRAAERAYTSYLNKLRVDVFAGISSKFQKMDLPMKGNEELYKSLAGFVNNATGRGDLGKLNRISQQLNTLFFSPRLIASRFNMLNPLWYAKQPPLVRKEAIKSFAEFVGVGTTIVTLAKLGGAEVETDPRSTDWGKIRVGNTRWDIWGGFQQWGRVFSQIASGERKTQKGDIIPLSRKKFPFETRFDVTERFLRGKLAPVPSLALELFEGSKLFGEEIKFTQEVAENITPLYLQDIKEAFEQLGPWSMLTVGAPAFFGAGTQTYEEKKKENRFNF